MRRLLAAGVAVVAVLGACVQPAPDNDLAARRGAGMTTGDQGQDWGAIQQLEEEARVLARATGCTLAEQCRTAPVGNRACGGPRYYLVYCDRTTDSTALGDKLLEVVQAEDEYNHRYEVVSTCEFRMPPEVAFSGGECRPATEQEMTP